jgi:hypothetical protein
MALKPIVLVGILTLPGTGCAQQADNSTTDAITTTSPTPTAGPTSFVAEARTMPFGTKDLAAASEACPTPAQASALVRSAVRHLCPQHASAID